MPHRIQACTWLQCVGLQRIREQGLEQDLYTLLGEKIYSDPLLFVRKNIAMTMEVLEMKNAMWETSERQLEDPSAERRIQAVLSLAALGLRYNRTQRHLLEMLDVDQSESVRVQIIRLFCSLGLKDPSIQRNLKMKEQGVGVLAREASKALRILQKTHRDFPNQCHNPSNG
ncbi:protein HEATR9-like [Rhinophrynus dorsalis]